MNGPLPYENLDLISVIDEIDVPILSHYRDNRNNDILRYFLGYEKSLSLSLYWRVKENELFNYLNNNITLRELITEDSKEFLYLPKNDEGLYEYISPNHLPEDFLPDGKSYYGFAIPQEYEYLVEKFLGDFYVANLKERGVVLNISPKGRRFQHTVSMEDVADMTSRVSSSIKSFVDQQFYKDFKSIIQDIKTFESTRKKVIKKATPRVCDSRLGSFEITISNDRVNNEDLEKQYTDWTNKILSAYQNQVLYVDYSDPDVIKSLLENHSILEIKNIYEPIVNTIAQKDYILSVRTIGTDKSIAFNKDYRKTKKEIRKTLYASKEAEVGLTKKKILHLVLEIEEGQEVGELNKSQISKDTIVSYETRTFAFKIEELSRPERKFYFNEPLEFDVKIDENNNYWIEDEVLGEPIFTDDKMQIRDEILKALNSIIDNQFKGNSIDFFKSNNISIK